MTGEHRGEEQEEGRSGQEGRQDSPELEPLEMKGDAPG
jgi:hypothetical protein